MLRFSFVFSGSSRTKNICTNVEKRQFLVYVFVVMQLSRKGCCSILYPLKVLNVVNIYVSFVFHVESALRRFSLATMTFLDFRPTNEDVANGIKRIQPIFIKWVNEEIQDEAKIAYRFWCILASFIYLFGAWIDAMLTKFRPLPNNTPHNEWMMKIVHFRNGTRCQTIELFLYPVEYSHAWCWLNN